MAGAGPGRDGPGGEAAPPEPRFEVLGCEPEAGRWRVVFRVVNHGAPVVVHEAWVPHPRFRAPRESFDPPLRLAPGEARDLSFPVTADRSEGEVENAFLVLRVSRDGDAWRVFARISVDFSPDGAPLPRVSRVTVDGATLPGGGPA